MEAPIDRARSTTSRTSSSAKGSRDGSRVAVNGRRASKPGVSSSAISVASSDHNTSIGDSLQSSGDGALDKFARRSSLDDTRSEGSASHRRKLSRLFKGRRRRRQSLADDDLSHVDPVEDIPPLPTSRIHSNVSMDPPSQSDDSIAGLHKSIPSSLLTDDSDTEGTPGRPPLSQHNSHAGFLTLSSPLVASETLDSSSGAEAKLVDSVTSAIDRPNIQHAKTLDVAANARRSPSPVGRLKEAFTPTKRSTSPRASGGSDSAKASPGGGALGQLFGGKRPGSKGGSKLVDGAPNFTASPPQLHEGFETRSTPNLASHAPKRIITQLPATPPNLNDAPTTLVTPPTPTDVKPASPTGSTSSKSSAKHNPSQSNPNVVISPTGNMISHRRIRSATNPPSKLSNSITAPLTPTLEEVKSPGGTASLPQSGGFFSSVFSAAQNAANTLSTTIANTTATNKTKFGNSPTADEKKTGDVGGEEVIGPENVDVPAEDAGVQKRRPAVETLGSGNLSLAQLGITGSSDPSPMSSATNLNMQTDQASAKVEDAAAAQAISAAYSAQEPRKERPRSLTVGSGAGAISPPRQGEITDSPAAMSTQRQGSIRSRISGGRRRRHRGSSATTGTAATMAPGAAPNGQRLNGTGFAVASSKRNRDFHNLFKSVPEDDYLIEDYSAALQKEILLQGRLYISEGHLCFSSNILGWVTNLVISFDEVVSVEKKSTAVLFPNAIVIQTLHARNVFASFLSRDSTYDLIIGIWKISHPNLKSSLNGVTLDGSGTGDKTEKAESVGSEDGSVQDSDDEVYDEDAEEDEGVGSFTEAGDGSLAASEQGSVNGERKTSAVVAQAVGGTLGRASEALEAAVGGAGASQDFPGAPTHGATECGDSDLHYDKLLIDTTIPAPLGKVYSMTFGPTSGAFMRKWLIEDQKSTDLQMEDDKKGLGEATKTGSYSYTKPLPGSIGPRQTRCNINMTLEQFDLDKAVTVLCSTQTPDVPSGSVFLTKTRYCLMWGPNNTTRLIMTFTVEWSGKSWLKGPIEKGANDGQLTYSTALAAALRTAVTTKALAKIPTGKPGRLKKGRKARIEDDSTPTPPSESANVAATQAKKSDWGLFEPIRLMLGPAADIIESIFLVSTRTVLIILTILLIYSWFFRSSAPRLTHGHLSLSSSQRAAAYEEIWRTEESELWKWLEERVALDRVQSSVAGKVAMGREFQDRVVGEGLRERQIDEAIRVTEERLGALKAAVNRSKKGKEGGK
ncbi:hypothetical protein P154DRAFT_526294 [Amniculicola lignicola CBS 123094]|uniref:VASt domain-containing protein n=1 Tax=Amniculicola lignicola CBS 123094 TaxID=1392246 RepID=A0A6A5W142_9PLEO|nr:hypothetical protein P154DRAFT_526294 [Amniculicola lignicola CBS 123094]